MSEDEMWIGHVEEEWYMGVWRPEAREAISLEDRWQSILEQTVQEEEEKMAILRDRGWT